jgi:hypothetical protein
MTLVSTTRDRVPSQTAEEIERRIQQGIEDNVRYFAGRPAEIARRLRELDQEWDIERAIEANAAVLGFVGTALAARGSRAWLALPALVTGFLLQHAIQGWCPPVPALRRAGFRTSYEIDEERQALKALRGDFDAVTRAEDKVAAALKAARA